MAWFDEQNIKQLKLNFPYVCIIALAYCYMQEIRERKECENENNEVYRAMYEDKKQDIRTLEQVLLANGGVKAIRDTIYIVKPDTAPYSNVERAAVR